MVRRTARVAALGERLDGLLASYDAARHRRDDPVSLVHRYADPADQEVAGLVAALLAFGNVTTIRRSVARVLDVLGPRPAEAIAKLRLGTLERRLDGFVHRVYRGPHVARLLHRAGAVRRRRGSLGAHLAASLDAGRPLRDGLADLSDELRGDAPDRGMRHLVADPRAGSACKRSLLYLRWMVRPADGVDLGVWRGVSPGSLVIPVDTHILRIAHNLRLTDRRDASWRTAEEITAALRVYDPGDPVKYDFALCHMGVSRQCPSRRDPALCEPCALRPSCRHWARGR